MLNQLLTSALAVSSVAAAVIYENEAASLAARQTVTNCPALHVVACGGANSTVPSSIGRLGTLANNITSMVPNSDFVSVPYDKIQVGGMGQKLQPGAIDKGIMNMEQYVAEFSSSCPNSKMAFIGYSSGAVITMGSFCGGSVSHALAGTSVVAVTVYGDPTRVPGLSYDIGTGPKCVGKDSNLRNPASCGTYASIIKSWCDVNDPQCCSGPAQDYPIHLSYPGKYDLVAAKYVVDQYNMAIGMGNSSTSSNTSMSATSSSATATGIIGGGLGGSSSSTASSATVNSSASAASMASALSALGASASSSSSAASSMTSAASSARNTALAAASSVASRASSAANTAAAQASSTLTPANPNSASLLAPSFGLGALAVIMVALY